MGITIPPNPPLLDPADIFFVSVDNFGGAGCTIPEGGGVCVRTGAQINAYYAAGGDCVAGNDACNSGIHLMTRVLLISDPI